MAPVTLMNIEVPSQSNDRDPSALMRVRPAYVIEASEAGTNMVGPAFTRTRAAAISTVGDILLKRIVIGTI